LIDWLIDWLMVDWFVDKQTHTKSTKQSSRPSWLWSFMLPWTLWFGCREFWVADQSLGGHATTQEVEVEALAQTNEQLQSEVDDLGHQNSHISKNLQHTEESVYNLQKACNIHWKPCKRYKDNPWTIMKNNWKNHAIFQQQYEGQSMQNLISVLLGADEDGNMILSDDDIEDIIHRLEGLHNVNINDALLRQLIIDNGRSVEAVMALAKHALMADSGDADDSLFTFLQEDDEEE
jgi:hypothetical protein